MEKSQIWGKNYIFKVFEKYEKLPKIYETY